MLELISSNQIDMCPKSDLTLHGEIKMRNTSKDWFIPYKIKCTNSDHFHITPNRGVLEYNYIITIHISTLESFTLASAKQLSSNHKFEVEYIVMDHKPKSIVEAVAQIQGPQVRSQKIYLNTDTPEINNMNTSSGLIQRIFQFLPRETESQPLVSQAAKLEQYQRQVDKLELQKSSLILEKGKKKFQKAGFLKKVLVLIVGLVVGNFGGKLVGIPETTNQLLSKYTQKVVVVQVVQEKSSSWF